jgi:hypothetical protein
MNLQDLGLIHPEWDSGISDDELARCSSVDGPVHGLSRTLYAHLPHDTKVQLAVQQKHLDSLVDTMLTRLEKVNSAPAVDGGGFYNDGTGRDLIIVCKSIIRAQSKLKIHMMPEQRQSLIQGLFEFVVRHGVPTLVFHPKVLRNATTLLDSLLNDELRQVLNVRSYQALEEKGLVPKVEKPSLPPLRLDWKPLHAFIRVILNMDEDRRNAVHYRPSSPLAPETLTSLVRRCAYFFDPQFVEGLFQTVFPLLSSRPGERLDTLVAAQPTLIDYQLRISKVEDAVLMSHMLPVLLAAPSGPHSIDYEDLVEQILEVWAIIPNSPVWDRAMVTMLTDISRYFAIRWKPEHVRTIFACPLRQLKLATAGTQLPSPGQSNTPSQILGQFSQSVGGSLGRQLGALMAQIIASDHLFAGKPETQDSDAQTPTSIFISWLEQIEHYLHPNNQNSATTHLKNILMGVVSDLSDRFKASIMVDDLVAFKAKTTFSASGESQGHYDFLGIPTIFHGNLDRYLIREPVWDALCPIFDRIRVHLAGASLGRDLAFLIAHVRPSYIESSIFPRIIYALENPMLGSHVPSSLELLALLMPLLLNSQPQTVTRLQQLLDPILSHVDPNDVSKSVHTFNLVLSLTIALNDRKKRKAIASRAKHLNAISIPSDLAGTLVEKAFTELLAKNLHNTPPTRYRPKESANNLEHAVDLDLLESELVSLESFLSEWIIAFFDRTLEFIDGVPRGASASASLIQCLNAVIEFSDDGSTFGLLLRRLSSAIESTHRSKTDLNPVLDAFAKTRPIPTLTHCLESWLPEVKKRASSKAGSHLVESEVEAIAWKLDVVRLICKRFGAPIGSHEKALLSFIEPLLKDNDKRIRKAALSVLPAALGPLKPVFNARVDPIDHFKSFTDVLLDQALFLEPTAETLDLAARWVGHFVAPILATMQQMTQTCVQETLAPPGTESPSTVSIIPKNFSEQLRLLFEIISALGPILPQYTSARVKLGETSLTSSTASAGSSDLVLNSSQQLLRTSGAEFNELVLAEESASKRRESLVGQRLKVGLQKLQLPEPLLRLRESVILSTQAFISASIVTGKCQEPKIVRRSFKILIQALVHNGAKETKWADKLSRLRSSITPNAAGEGSEKKNAREEANFEKSGSKQSLSVAYPARYTLSPLHPYYRPWRIGKSATLLQNRWAAVRYKLSFGAAEIECLRSYIALASTHPTLVGSQKLVKLLLENVPRLSGSTPFFNNMLLTLISVPLQPNQPLDAFSRFVSFLAAPFASGNTAANWKNLNQFVQVLRGLHIHDHAVLQTGIQHIFTLVLVQCNAMAATPLQDAGFFNSYTSMMDTCLQDLNSVRPNTHWRYHLYTLTLICAFIRRNIHTPQVSTETSDTTGPIYSTPPPGHPGLNGLFVLKSLIPILSDVLPMARSLARHTVRRLLTWAQEVEDGAHAEVVAPLLDPVTLDTLLMHISSDRQPRRLDPSTLDPIIASVIVEQDPSGSIGDCEWGIGAELVQMGTFRLALADLWFRLFNSLRFGPDPNTAMQAAADYIANKLTENLVGGKRVSVAATVTDAQSSQSGSSDETSPPTPSEGDKETAAPLTLMPPPSNSSPAPSSSPSPDHVEEMERYFYSLVEMATGFTRAFPEVGQHRLWHAIINSPRISANRMSSLIFAIAYLVNYNISLVPLEAQLLEPILKPQGAKKAFGDLSVFEVESRLILLTVYYQESRSAKIDPLVNLSRYLFIEKRVASMPKPQLRSASLRLLVLLSAVLSRTGHSHTIALDVHRRTLELLMEPIGAEPQELPANAGASVSTVATTATGSQVPVTAEDRIKSTFLAWVAECIANRVTMLVDPDWWTLVTKQVLELSVDPATSTASSARSNLVKLSQLIVAPVSALEQVVLVKQVENVKKLTQSHPRWKARQSMLLYLRFFMFNHALLLPRSEIAEFMDWAKHLVEDGHVDVRKSATVALSSLVRSFNPSSEIMAQTASYFLQVVATNNVKRPRAKQPQEKGEKGTEPMASESVAKVLAGAAGLAALAAACPFSVPSWLPVVIIALQRLSNHTNGSIATLASEEVAQFWKTHRDEWYFHQRHFTEEQLRILEDKPIPSYYA